MDEAYKKGNPAANLTDDLIVEILSRLPAKALCRFKCVSRRWRDLITHPANRNRLLQTLSGFFFPLVVEATRPPAMARHFVSLSSPGRGPPLVDPPFSFLPSYRGFQVLDCCNGLLLLRSWGISKSLRFFVVCNPATRKWVALPESSQAGKILPAYLGFDPAVSSHFYVFQLVGREVDDEEVEDEEVEDFLVEGVDIYSSETGRWVLKGEWIQTDLLLSEKTSYLNGFLHFITIEGAVPAVDAKGQRWRTIPAPHGVQFGFIGHSQGCLFYVNTDQIDAFSLSIYVLEDYSSKRWTLKHSVSTSDLFGCGKLQFGGSYSVVAVHPDCNLIFFFDWSRKALMSYDMDNRNVHVICTIRQAHRPFLPYVPLYSEALALSNVR